MISITIIAVGKLKEKYLTDGCAEYIKRLGAYCKVSIIEIPEERCPDNPSPSQIENVISKEGERILAKIPKGSAVIPMCIEGKQFESTEFAQKINELSNNGYSCFTFVIGGSFGLDDRVKNSGILKLSMSKMTFPHQLARMLLLEQIYRAFQINTNGKYHK